MPPFLGNDVMYLCGNVCLSSINQPFPLSQEPDPLLRRVGLAGDHTLTLGLHEALGHTVRRQNTEVHKERVRKKALGKFKIWAVVMDYMIRVD